MKRQTYLLLSGVLLFSFGLSLAQKSDSSKTGKLTLGQMKLLLLEKDKQPNVGRPTQPGKGWLPLPETKSVDTTGTMKRDSTQKTDSPQSIGIRRKTLRNESTSEYEPHVAVSPANQQNFIAVHEGVVVGVARPRATYTIDGGATWNVSDIPVPNLIHNWTSDPVISFDRLGNAYYAYMDVYRPCGATEVCGILQNAIVVMKSTDRGATWIDRRVVISDENSQPTYTYDKPWIACDQSNSANQNNVYVTRTKINNNNGNVEIQFSRKRPSDQDFQTPITIGPTVTGYETLTGSQVVVAPDGTVYVFWLRMSFVVHNPETDPVLEETQGSIWMAKSTDGGLTFPSFNVVQLTDLGTVQSVRHKVLGGLFQRANSMPSVTIRPIGSSYEICVIWSDNRNSKPELFFAKTGNNGISWTVNRLNQFSYEQFMPSVTSTASGGVFISYFDRVNTTSNDVQPMVGESVDGGVTFNPSSPSGSSFSGIVVVGSGPRDTLFTGDYAGIAANDYTYWAIWPGVVGSGGTANNDLFGSYRGVTATIQNQISGATTYVQYNGVARQSPWTTDYEVSGSNQTIRASDPVAVGSETHTFQEWRDENNNLISNSLQTVIQIGSHTYTAKFSVAVNAIIKNEFKEPNGTISSGGIVNVYSQDYNTDLLPSQQYETSFPKNGPSPRLEAKQQQRGVYWRGLNPLANQNGGWEYPNHTREYNTVAYPPLPLDGGLYLAHHRNRYDVTLSTPTFVEPGGTGGSYTGGGPVWQYESTTIQANSPTGWLFGYWSDANSANPRNLQPMDNINLSAVFKKHLASTFSNATGSPTQRKIAMFNSIAYAAYASGGSIWFTKNDGSGWSAEKLVFQSTSARNPSIAVAYEAPYIAIHVAWDYDYTYVGQTTRRVIYAKSLDDGAHWTGRTLDYGEPAGTDIFPVTTAGPSGAIVVWKRNSLPSAGLMAKPLPLLDAAVAPYAVLRGTGTTTGSPSTDNFIVVYNNNGNITYDQIGIQNNAIAYSIAAPEVASVFQYSGSTPSVAYVPVGSRSIVAWNVSSNIYLRERVSGVWQSAQYVSALGGTSQPPVASYDSDLDRYVVLWQSDSHIEKTSRPVSSTTWRAPLNLGNGTYPSMSSEIKIGSEGLWTLSAGSYYEVHPAKVSASHLQSISSTATATGSQRKIVRNPQSGLLHMTYESDGDIFVTRSSDNGATWSTEQCVSRGYADCSAPSIAERYGTVYVVWQRGTGPTYDIMYSVSANSGISWYAPAVLQTVQSSGYAPRPVVAANPVQYDPVSLMIVYKGNNKLLSAYTTVGVPGLGNWQFADVPGTNDQSRDPSLAYTSSYPPLRLVWCNGGSVMYQVYYPGSWQQPTQVNGAIAGSVYNNYVPSLAFSASGNTHIAWQGLRPPWQEIIHNYNLNPTVFTEFLYPYYNHYYAPSISGHSGGRATLAWQAPSSYMYKATYSGSSWSSTSSLGVGLNPSLSISNPPGDPAWFAYEGVSGPPYAVSVGGGDLNKTNAEDDSTAYPTSRRIVLATRNIDEDLSIEIALPVLENASDSLVAFVPVVDTVEYDADNIWALLETPAFTARAHELPLKARYVLHGKRGRGVRNPILNIPLRVEVINASTGQVLAQEHLVSVASDSGTTISGQMHLRPSITFATDLKFRVRLERAAPRQLLQAAVVNVYTLDTTSALLKTDFRATRGVLAPEEFAIRPNYPNPFNPTTTISFDLPTSSNVTLVVYDVLGRKITELVNGLRTAGYHSAIWNASSVASGVYFARFTAADAAGNVKLNKVSKLLLAK